MLHLYYHKYCRISGKFKNVYQETRKSPIRGDFLVVFTNRVPLYFRVSNQGLARVLRKSVVVGP